MTIELCRMRDLASPADVAGCDLLIYALTAEPRGTFVVDAVGPRAVQQWAVHQSNSDAPVAGPAPDASVVSVESVGARLKSWLAGRTTAPLVAIDVSCMSRPAMAHIIEAICCSTVSQPVRLALAYVIAAYSPPPTWLPPNEDIKPISDWFAGWPRDAAASTALVVGLGYERDKAEGACEYFDASETWVLVPRSPVVEYDEAVARNNVELLARSMRRSRAIDYRVSHPCETFGQLASTVANIVPRMNPVLLPFGPKIFFAISLLMAAVYREVGVWHVTGDADLPRTAHASSGHFVGLQVELRPASSLV